MKFSLEDISDVSSLVTELAPGLRELNLEDNVEGFLKGMAMNLAIVGGMRGSTKIARLGQNDVTRYYKAK